MRLNIFYNIFLFILLGVYPLCSGAMYVPPSDSSTAFITVSESRSAQRNDESQFVLEGDTFALKPYAGNSDLAELPIGVEASMVLCAKGQKTKSGSKILSYSIQYTENQKASIIPINTNIANYLAANVFQRIFLTLNDSNQVQLLDVEDQPQHLRCVYKMPFNQSDKNSQDIKNFPFNHPSYNVVHATANGSRTKVIFASNMPGGFGGYDLYITYLRDSSFSKPVNLGAKINTPGDELFPFLINDTQIFFSTNGHTGNNFDIFTGSLLKNATKARAIKGLDSEYNEFAFVADATLSWGALATDRPNKFFDLNIYNFFRQPKDREQLYQKLKKEIDYKDAPSPRCVSLDIGSSIDTLGAAYLYHWDMGDHVGIAEGSKIEYCYKNPGKYTATLTTIMKEAPTIVDTVLRVPIEISESLAINVGSLDSAFLQETVEFMVATNVVGKGTTVEEAVWRTDEKTYFSGANVVIPFSAPGWHKVEVLVRLNFAGKERIMYQTKKVFIIK